jgi:2-phospho-L-lactate transferase/gluconeogenesis factor (CofD/UPF0052 family)
MRPDSQCVGQPDSPGEKVRVVLFSGGRGSGALSKRLVTDPDIDLAIAINGYDDGASTGRVRRFLGDSLGPSDFRKNASHLARELGTCEPGLVTLLDLRLPVGCTRDAAHDALAGVRTADAGATGARAQIQALASGVAPSRRDALGARLEAFERERASGRRPFDFSDCAVGNLVFGGSFLLCGRRFNDAVDDYCALVGLEAGLVENVTDGRNAYLAAIDVDNGLLATEEAIVDATQRNRIRDIYLLEAPLTDDEQRSLRQLSHDACAAALTARSETVRLNPRLEARIARAELIVYAPGTQHSSLFPSYLTPGLSRAIAANLMATKLLVTNLQPDAEITGSSAVDIIERAVFYLKEKGRLSIPTPALITHYLINEPDPVAPARPYVPMGRLDALDDPRLVRIGHYEDGVTGRHDASKLLRPFLDTFVVKRRRRRVAVVLHDADSPNKLCQTVLEMLRGGIADGPADVSVFHDGTEPLDADFASRLPFPVEHIAAPTSNWDDELRRRLRAGAFDYVVLFESSGMYRGEDIVSLLSPLLLGRLDAVWGSRRLSVRDVEESSRLRYEHNLLLGAASAVGSYALSLAYLLLYGRYASDTLSCARAMRTALFVDAGVRLAHKQSNQRMLSHLMRQRAEIQEVYVRFVPLSPERVKRTTILDGLVSIATIVGRRFASGGAARTNEGPSTP